MLSPEKEQERRFILRDILYGLASSETYLENPTIRQTIYAKFDEIYSDGEFRHYYSDIYSTITDIDTNVSKGNLEVLASNMLYIMEHIDAKMSDNTKNSIRKLYDHSNLDISRINYVNSLHSKYLSKEQELIEMQGKLIASEEALKEAVNKTQSDFGQLYANILTLMGIFVALFAFIAVNANITFELTQENYVDIFWGIIKVNIFVAICIFVLVLSLKLFVIKPLIKHKKEGK